MHCNVLRRTQRLRRTKITEYKAGMFSLCLILPADNTYYADQCSRACACACMHGRASCVCTVYMYVLACACHMLTEVLQATVTTRPTKNTYCTPSTHVHTRHCIVYGSHNDRQLKYTSTYHRFIFDSFSCLL
eukprot:scpid74362/ scgid24229/ 